MSLFFFFLMIRRPPRSTLFPTRRSSDLSTSRQIGQSLGVAVIGSLVTSAVHGPLRTGFPQASHLGWWVGAGCGRSEEHTSELQSRSDLVCRLLLEKKKDDRVDSSGGVLA